MCEMNDNRQNFKTARNYILYKAGKQMLATKRHIIRIEWVKSNELDFNNNNSKWSEKQTGAAQGELRGRL